MSKQKIALVTGATKRIGRAISLALGKAGWNLCIHYNESEEEAHALSKTLASQKVKAIPVKCDLSDPDATENLVSECESSLGTVSLLVNNASSFIYDDINTFAQATWDKTMAVNLRSPIQLAHHFAEKLGDLNKGCIINLLDQKVFNLNPDYFSYTISKIGLEGATRILAMALAPQIRVCGVAPGITIQSKYQTVENFENAHKLAPLGHSSTAEDIASAVCYLAHAQAVTGVTLTVDGGQHLWPLERDFQFITKKYRGNKNDPL